MTEETGVEGARVAALERELAEARGERDALRGLLRALQPNLRDVYARLDAAVTLGAASVEDAALLQRLREESSGFSRDLYKLGRLSESFARVLLACGKEHRKLGRDITDLIQLANKPSATDDELGDCVSALSYSTEGLAARMCDAGLTNTEQHELVRAALAGVRDTDAKLDGLRERLHAFLEQIESLSRARDVMQAQLSEVARSQGEAPVGPPDASALAALLAAAIARTKQIATRQREHDASRWRSVEECSSALLQLADDLAERVFELACKDEELKAALTRLLADARPIQPEELAPLREFAMDLGLVTWRLERSSQEVTRAGKHLGRLVSEEPAGEAPDAGELVAQLEAIARALSPQG